MGCFLMEYPKDQSSIGWSVMILTDTDERLWRFVIGEMIGASGYERGEGDNALDEVYILSCGVKPSL